MKKISLVLSGGGARGIAHIGVIEELEKQGYEIHSITGTSMGAVVGGIYATGNIEEFKKWLLALNKLEVFKLIDFTLFKSGFIKADRVFKELSSFIEDKNIEDLPIRFSATASDLIAREEVLFTEGSLYNALRSSVAIPNVITPVKNENSVLVDGGVVNNIPLNRAHRIENDLLVAVNVNAEIPKSVKRKEEDKQSLYQITVNKFTKKFKEIFSDHKRNKLSYFDVMNLSFELMREEMVKNAIKSNPPDILIETSRYSCNIFDFYRAEELIEIGRSATKLSLDKYNN